MSTTQNDCAQNGIPVRLRQNGRSKDSQFDSEESLYRWHQPGIQHLPDGTISASAVGKAFRDPHDTSVNREEYCLYPTDVLYDHKRGNHRADHGVVKTSVGSVNDYSESVSWQDHNGNTVRKEYQFRAHHDPEECMYPHSVIAVYDMHGDEERLTDKPSARTAKSALRAVLRSLFVQCHPPDDEFSLEDLES